MPRPPYWRRGHRLSHRGDEPRELEPGDLRRMRQLSQTVDDNRAAIAAARIHPRLWRQGKKVPPFALLPPSPSDPKKIRNRWQMAARIAEAHADQEKD